MTAIHTTATAGIHPGTVIVASPAMIVVVVVVLFFFFLGFYTTLYTYGLGRGGLTGDGCKTAVPCLNGRRRIKLRVFFVIHP